MGKTIYQRTMITTPDGANHVFNRGDEVPDEIAEHITNPNVWEDSDQGEPGPDPYDATTATVDLSPPVSGTVRDAPYAAGSDFPVVTEDSGPVESAPGTLAMDPDRSGSERPETIDPEGGGSSEGTVAAGTKPSSATLERMNRAQLDATASSLGISDPESYPTKDELRAAIDSVDAPVE